MEIITMPCGPVMANSYVVRREGSPTCAVIERAAPPVPSSTRRTPA